MESAYMYTIGAAWLLSEQHDYFLSSVVTFSRSITNQDLLSFCITFQDQIWHTLNIPSTNFIFTELCQFDFFMKPCLCNQIYSDFHLQKYEIKYSKVFNFAGIFFSWIVLNLFKTFFLCKYQDYQSSRRIYFREFVLLMKFTKLSTFTVSICVIAILNKLWIMMHT